MNECLKVVVVCKVLSAEPSPELASMCKRTLTRNL